MTSTLIMVAAISYVLAAVLAAVAAIFYMTQHVRAVHDELSGRSAQREIAEMRAGRRGRLRLGAVGSTAASAAAVAGVESGSLHVRVFEPETNEMEFGVAGVRAVETLADGANTTLIAAPAAAASVDDEANTALLGAPACEAFYGDEDETKLLDAENAATFDADEAGTTLLHPFSTEEVR